MDYSQLNTVYSDNKPVELDIHSLDLAPLLVYPHFDKEEYEKRLAELGSLGVRSVTLEGRTTISGKRIAGKGCVGLVMKAQADGKNFALKVRRIDADRKTLQDEVALHTLANHAGIGPKLIRHSDNFILMSFIEGTSIIDWMDSGVSKKEAYSVAKSVLEQCFDLDQSGLDHGELSDLSHHVITDGTVSTIVDFESASTNRKTCNVTATAQSLFLYGAVSSHMKKIVKREGKEIDMDRALLLLRIYKHNQTRENFGNVLAALLV